MCMIFEHFSKNLKKTLNNISWCIKNNKIIIQTLRFSRTFTSTFKNLSFFFYKYEKKHVNENGFPNFFSCLLILSFYSFGIILLQCHSFHDAMTYTYYYGNFVACRIFVLKIHIFRVSFKVFLKSKKSFFWDSC